MTNYLCNAIAIAHNQDERVLNKVSNSVRDKNKNKKKKKVGKNAACCGASEPESSATSRSRSLDGGSAIIESCVALLLHALGSLKAYKRYACD